MYQGEYARSRRREWKIFILSKSQGWSVLKATEPELKSKSEARSVMIFKLFALVKIPSIDHVTAM